MRVTCTACGFELTDYTQRLFVRRWYLLGTPVIMEILCRVCFDWQRELLGDSRGK